MGKQPYIVIREKDDGSLRRFIDPQELNQNISRSFYEIPSIYEIAAKLENAKYFSVLDLKQGFWHIELDDE